MTVWEALILGVVQGMTEFLPISSTGHVVIAQRLLGVGDGALAFATVVHLGSLAAVVGVFREELLLMARALVARKAAERAAGLRLLALLVLATLPIVVVGLTVRDAVESAFASPLVPPVMFALTGVLLWSADARQRRAEEREPGGRHALWMGLGQAAAVLPGLSRSGTTLAVGVWAGLSREAAARFSFLMSIPTLLGAAVLELPEALAGSAGEAALGPGVVVAGVLASAAASYAAIAFLLRFLQRGRLLPFALYAWAFSLLAFVLAFTGF